MRVLGMISGTSHDAIEVAVADLELAGDEIRAALVASGGSDFPPELRAQVVAALPPRATTMADVCRLDTLLGQAFAAAAADMAAAHGPVDLVVSHGQTLYHWVEGRTARGTLQLGEPAWIAERVGAPVVSGVRSRDIAVGGQGAPLVSTLDVLLLAGDDVPAGRRASLNLGGIANLTVVDPARPVAFDVGPANALLDAAVATLTGGERSYDAGGAWAARGSVDDALLAGLLEEPYYALPAPKSTGKELFSGEYLAARGVDLRTYDPADLLATLTALTAQTVADAAHRHGVVEVVAAGGGIRNRTMVDMLVERGRGLVVDVIDRYGIPSTAKEAYAFALLGFLTWHGVPATVPSCTGAARASLLGSITPGRGPLRLPTPAAGVPRRFVVTRADPAASPARNGRSTTDAGPGSRP
jgi:anhydro-N-acetylmuramic acid kinase